jgi:hypothetical protein
MFMGSDMFVLGVFFVVCLYLIYKSTDRGGISAYAGMALLAFLSTSRVVFLYLIAIVAFFLYRKDRFKYFRHICFSLTLALILHGYFFLPDPAAYSPLHIITKGDQLLTNPFRIFCIIAFLTAIYLTFKKLKNNLRSWIFYFWLATAIPLFFISLSDLSLQKFNFSRWEGANYLMIVIPAYLFYFVMCLAEENKEGF